MDRGQAMRPHYLFLLSKETVSVGLLRNPSLESDRSLTRKRPSTTAAVPSLALAAFCPFGQQEANRRFFNSPSVPIIPFRLASQVLHFIVECGANVNNLLLCPQNFPNRRRARMTAPTGRRLLPHPDCMSPVHVVLSSFLFLCLRESRHPSALAMGGNSTRGAVCQARLCTLPQSRDS